MSTLSTTNLKNPSSGSNNIVLDSSARVLVGTSTSRAVVGAERLVQIEGTSATTTGLAITRNSNDANPAFIGLAKTRGTANGSFTLVQSGDLIGSLGYAGADGSSLINAAEIRCEVDGTPGANDMPGRLVFSVTRDSEASPKEALKIDNQGRVAIGLANIPSGLGLAVQSSSTSDNDGTLQAVNTSTTAAACVASFNKGTNSTATSNVLLKFTINAGASGSGQINANGASAAAFGTFSDARLKENIEDLPSQWNKIKSLRPVEFDYLESFGGGHQIGFIAQEMQTVYPDAVGIGQDEMLTVTAWSKTEARLVKALQEALERIETLEAEVSALQSA